MHLTRLGLQTVFDEVVVVDVMDSEDRVHLSLLGRPELGITFTKIHCWTLTQYSKCVFLDADTLVSAPTDETVSDYSESQSWVSQNYSQYQVFLVIILSGSPY